MLNLLRSEVAVLLALSVSGCSTRLQIMTEAERSGIAPAFRGGRTVLDCRMACSWQ